MKKIVINKCFGGFGLSEEGYQRYAELKGLKLYPEKDKEFRLTITHWIVPPNKRPKPLKKEWGKNSLKVRQKFNDEWEKCTIYDNDIPRDDPILVQVVEELKEKANGRCAKLKVVEIPDCIEWEISEYDGNEQIEETHKSWS
jgi:hypothetical protein